MMVIQSYNGQLFTSTDYIVFIFSREASPATLVSPQIDPLQVHNQQPAIQHHIIF